MSYIYPLSENMPLRYKVYFVYNFQKIYLGIFDSQDLAQKALLEAEKIMSSEISPYDSPNTLIPFKKFITLCNLRDHKVYIKNPIYIYSQYFCYFLSPKIVLTFDIKDLLFFSTYKIFKRGLYLYTQDHVSQQSILSRFGIPKHAVLGKDYKLKNGDCYDFRRENIELVNAYIGVTLEEKNGVLLYVAKIFIQHNLIIGHYETDLDAAIAYNKAVDKLTANGNYRDYVKNTIPFLTVTEYNAIYDRLIISPTLSTGSRQKRVVSQKKYRGTCKDKSGFRANIGYKGKQIYLGNYPTEKRAAQAYNFASFYLYGNSGYINDITPLVDDHDTSRIAHYFAKYHILKQPTKAHTPS